jgi:hypothetical protein
MVILLLIAIVVIVLQQGMIKRLDQELLTKRRRFHKGPKLRTRK